MSADVQTTARPPLALDGHRSHMQSRWRSWKGQELLHLDYSGFKNDFDALRAEVEQADAIVMRQRRNSVLVLIDLRDTVASTAVVSMFKQSSPLTEPFIRRHALLGVTGIKRFLADKVARLTGRAMRAFDTEEKAFDWLVEGAEDAGEVIGGAR
jgi:hypothetical protein